MQQAKKNLIIIIVVLAIAAAVYMEAVNPAKFGFYHDDGVYLVTANALATGKGYRIQSLPDEPWQTKYPPIFPLVLSLIWRANADFPANLPLFSCLSILGMLVFFALSAAFLIKHKFTGIYPIFLAVLLASLNWRTLILATSILSEALYAALAICTLWLASSSDSKHFSLKYLALGLALGCASLTRMAGISLLIAVLVHAIVRRKAKSVLFPVVLASAMVAAWVWWCHLNQASEINSYSAYYTNYIQDWRSMLRDGQTGFQISLLGTVASMLAKNAFALLANIPVVCIAAQMDWHEGMNHAMQFSAIMMGLFMLVLLAIGFWKTRFAANGLLHYYLISYLALHTFWPYALYDRFLIPLLPFILLFIAAGAGYLLHACIGHTAIAGKSGRRVILTLARVAVISILAIALYGSTLGLYSQLRAANRAHATTRENDKVFAWLKSNSSANDIFTCYQDPIYYLHTKRKAIRLPAPRKDESFVSYSDRLLEFATENRISFLVRTESDFSLESGSESKRDILANALNHHSTSFIPVYSSAHQQITVYRIP